ncbi:MAG TPA: pyridoxal phosphate-dependent aminotransferase [Acidimicrobiia bacterium]|nr:pyridoxal phosphate-dependent aminotransferase [Acidimicrobiia bacterium]
MGRISRRIGAIEESATLAVDAKAKALRAAGEAVIGFGAGEPDFPTPAHVVDAAVAAARDPRYHRYSPTPGLPELRAAIAEKTRRDSGFVVDASQVLVTNGGKHAVFNTFQTLLDPGDEVLLPAPYWTTYPEAITLGGGTPVPLATTEADGFRVTLDQLDAACTERTKALLFVSPSNPTGAVYPPDEVAAIGEWAVRRGLWVVTDEIYEHLTFGAHEFASIATLVPDLRDRCVVLNGVAKTYAMTGWRVGWMIGPPDVIAAASNFQSHSTSNVANVSQVAALAAVSGDLAAVAEMRAAFERRGALMHGMLAKIPGVTCLEPQGAFYCFPSFAGVLGKELAGARVRTSLELCEVLLEHAKVAIVPGEAFGAPGYARLSFALGDDDLGEGVRRIAELLETAR